MGANSHFWRKWLPSLTKEHRTDVVDLMGFGSARAPIMADYSPAGQARLLADFLRERGGDPPVLVGHSLGAGIALLAALLLKDAVPPTPLAGLVVVSGAVYEQAFPKFLSLARIPGIGELFLLAPPPRWALRRGIAQIVHDSRVVDDDLVEGYRRPLETVRRRWATLRTARQLDPRGGREMVARLGELDVPALLLWGAEDTIVSAALGSRLAQALPSAELILLPEVGHLLVEEAPEESAAALLRFTASLRR